MKINKIGRPKSVNPKSERLEISLTKEERKNIEFLSNVLNTTKVDIILRGLELLKKNIKREEEEKMEKIVDILNNKGRFDLDFKSKAFPEKYEKASISNDEISFICNSKRFYLEFEYNSICFKDDTNAIFGFKFSEKADNKLQNIGTQLVKLIEIMIRKCLPIQSGDTLKDKELYNAILEYYKNGQ